MRKPKILTTWCGSRVPASKMADVLKGWQRFARRLLRDSAKNAALPGLDPKSLEYQLTEILQRHCGERGHNEGAVDTLCRIICERDQALLVLALDRLRTPEQPSVVMVPTEPRHHEVKIRFTPR
jgi:hypothetical protein